MITSFAVPQPNGQFLVGKLDRPRETSLRRFAPEEAVVLTAATYQRVKDSPHELRCAVLGEPNPIRKLFRAVHVTTHPVDRAMETIDKIGSRIASWVDSGKPDGVSEGNLPESLTRIRNNIRDFGGYLNKKSTKRAYLDAPPEKREELCAKLADLRASFSQLSGMRFAGGEMNDLFTGIDGLNTFMAETDAGAPVTGSAGHIGSGTILFGTVQVEVYRLRFN